jgi:hypothetical protein
MNHTKMQWLQDPNQSNVDHLNTERREASTHFRNKEEYLKPSNDELETNSEIKNITDFYEGFHDLKKRNQPVTNIQGYRKRWTGFETAIT